MEKTKDDILEVLKERSEREYYWDINRSKSYIQQFGYSKDRLQIETVHRGIFTVYSMTGEEIHKLINTVSYEYELSKIPQTKEEYLVIVDIHYITRGEHVRTLAPANDLGIDHLLFCMSGEIEAKVFELYFPIQEYLLNSLKSITSTNTPLRVTKKTNLTRTFVTGNGDMYIGNFLEFSLPDPNEKNWSLVTVHCKTDMEDEVVFEVVDRYHNRVLSECNIDKLVELLTEYLTSMSIIYYGLLA